jgi:hypothetical protein
MWADGVRISARDPAAHTVSFTAVDVAGVRRTYANVPWADESVMWVCCPTSLPSRCSDPNDPAFNEANPPLVGATGTLLFQVDWAALKGIATRGPKWPASAPNPEEYRETTIVPSSLVLTGSDPMDPTGTELSINLRDLNMAEPGQTIHLNPNGMKVRVSKKVFQQLGQAFPLNRTTPELLKEAVDVLQGGSQDADALSHALGVLATSIVQVRQSEFAGDPNEALVELIKKVLPKFEA